MDIKQFLKKRFSTLYFFYVYLGYRLFLIVLFSTLMVLMDSLGIAMFIPLLQLADGATSAVDGGKITSFVRSFFGSLHIDITLYNMLAFIVLIFVSKGFFVFLGTKYLSISQQWFSKQLRTKLANGLRDLSYKEFIQMDIGRLQNSLISECWQVSYASSQYIETIKNGIFVLIYLVFSFFLDWKFTLLVVVGGGASNLIYRHFYNRTQELSRAITKNNHRYGAIVIEVVNHFKYLKASGRNITFFNRLQNELNDLIKNNIDVAVLGAKIAALREPLVVIVICIVIGMHVMVFKSPLSAVIVILVFFYRIMQKIIDIQTTWNTYLANIGALENVQDLQRTLDKDKDTFYNGSQPLVSIESITLNHIGLHYGGYKALSGISLHLHKNQSIAFVGESGAGKTSLINVLTGLLPYDEGEFLVNGIALGAYRHQDYKRKIGYISQEATVFNADIFDNITFWDERKQENLTKFQQVIKMASLSSFIHDLEDRENTLLGNNGINVSGGQKQRISIARELYRDAEILIMDEATSALDSETEWTIKQSIEALHGQVTIISIAHRLSTVQHADMIYLLSKGELVASGNFEELKQHSSYFKKLTELQGM